MPPFSWREHLGAWLDKVTASLPPHKTHSPPHITHGKRQRHVFSPRKDKTKDGSDTTQAGEKVMFNLNVAIKDALHYFPRCFCF